MLKNQKYIIISYRYDKINIDRTQHEYSHANNKILIRQFRIDLEESKVMYCFPSNEALLQCSVALKYINIRWITTGSKPY